MADPATPRWEPERELGALHRAVEHTRRRAARTSDVGDLLLALLDGDPQGAARAVLDEPGFAVTAEAITAYADSGDDPAPAGRGSISVGRPLAAVVAMASGLALGARSPIVTDEHLLLACCYREPTLLRDLGASAEAIVAALAARGVPVPDAAPPRPERRAGPHGPYVYVPSDDADAVVLALVEVAPPGGLQWGTNHSYSRPGEVHFRGEAELDIAAIARGAVRDPATVTVVAAAEADATERAAAPAPGAHGI